MDDPNLDACLHRSALDGLARLNLLSGSVRIIWPSIKSLAQSQHPRPLRIFDIATGAGDVPIRLWHRAKKLGLHLDITGCDISPVSLDYARQRAQQQHASIRFVRTDVLNDEIPPGFDCVVSSLFLHHLDEFEAELLLKKMAAAGRMVIINDLLRSRWNLLAVTAAVRMLSRSPIVRTDGPLSIHAAYKMEEIRRIADRAGLHGARIARRHPCRFLLVWSRT